MILAVVLISRGSESSVAEMRAGIPGTIVDDARNVPGGKMVSEDRSRFRNKGEGEGRVVKYSRTMKQS